MAKVWRNVGALWTKKDKSDREYYAGNLELQKGTKIPLTVWSNDRKIAGSNQPDYNIQTLVEVEDDPKTA